MKKVLKQAKGITLIALVVTIVILLILTGITLKLSIGDNSILARATKAAKDTKRGQAQDQIGLKFGESQIEIDESANKNYEEVVYDIIEKIKDAGVIGCNNITDKYDEDYREDKDTYQLDVQMQKGSSFYNAKATVTTHYDYDSYNQVLDNVDYEDFEEIDSVSYENRIMFDYLATKIENDHYIDDDYETDTAKLLYTTGEGYYDVGNVNIVPTVEMSGLRGIVIDDNSIFLNKIDGCYYEYVNYYSYESDTGRMFMRKVNLAPMTMKVNSGDNKNVVLNLGAFKGFVDWGDGQKDQNDVLEEPRYMQPSCLPKKFASIENNFKIALISYTGEFDHTYDEANKEYEITINGICPYFDFCNNGYYSNEEDTINEYQKVTSVEDWGSLGSIYTSLCGCQNLASIPDPTEETFKFNISMQESFAYCKALTSIPDNLFKWNTHTIDFSETFFGCENLTSIPAEIFDTNIDNIEMLNSTFAQCTKLTGDAPKLWEHVRRGRVRAKKLLAYGSSDEGYESALPDGRRCFAGDYDLSNYDEIPDYWKYIPQPD